MSASFFADVISPKPMRLELWQEPYTKTSFGSLPWLGWHFFSLPRDPADPDEDYVDDSFAQIIGYVERYHRKADWRDEDGNSVELRKLQPILDDSQRWALASWREVRDDGAVRVCINQFDDCVFRLTTERVRAANDMNWWEPVAWSDPFDDFAKAQENANRILSEAD
ncbi:hypothetical protein [Sphingomicrobium sediminis]|uniref:Uncharacterized protein n=1 Tax=Sphingomicrobium sediminis TaxID=2950949 RepID=A0A9X2EJM5_9SPHN|nr:hypothetical protein [Sphingomicrobium sediminis]MCM8558016.1 hypothetical protein [Sphingomicrobium sediminis]